MIVAIRGVGLSSLLIVPACARSSAGSSSSTLARFAGCSPLHSIRGALQFLDKCPNLLKLKHFTCDMSHSALPSRMMRSCAHKVQV
ncbi:hypothetical protein MPTK1_4g16530 [Marchantia polymorpha subsp. ruderalis]|uniref:Secreted protein n=2 Tax=Marchantia polymorpha TaxID=3197 RepID=A0AAF6BAJ4_MARPO|nr:hypothetical protein MARPO_0202s0001 [Marchantia polymorpha]BBN09028.1 hypothetical protein Mp_4g16530 [Marchantia polymorpha subsp. ruderalis]|eukprot:PTQ27372.1 hypothetical protein MARPO_0202s0001 [Marchantia polymorpha]